MGSTIDSGEKGYILSEQILFNFLALFPTLPTIYMFKLTIYPLETPLNAFANRADPDQAALTSRTRSCSLFKS